MDTLSCIKYIVTSSDVEHAVDGYRNFVIAIDKKLIFEKYNIAFELTDSPSGGKWVLEPSDESMTSFLAFMLNDPITLKNVFGSSISRQKKYRVTKSMISNLSIPACDGALLPYYSIIEQLFQSFYLKQEKNESDLLALDIFSSIRLALSFELHQFNLLKKFNITILSNWIEFIDKMGTDISKFPEILLSPDNALMNNVRRFQLLIGSIQQTINDELEIK